MTSAPPLTCSASLPTLKDALARSFAASSTGDLTPRLTIFDTCSCSCFIPESLAMSAAYNGDDKSQHCSCSQLAPSVYSVADVCECTFVPAYLRMHFVALTVCFRGVVLRGLAGRGGLLMSQHQYDVTTAWKSCFRLQSAVAHRKLVAWRMLAGRGRNGDVTGSSSRQVVPALCCGGAVPMCSFRTSTDWCRCCQNLRWQGSAASRQCRIESDANLVYRWPGGGWRILGSDCKRACTVADSIFGAQSHA